MGGIDYGMGKTNIDNETGIRYGVINQIELLQAWCDESDAEYGPACCPDCGNELEKVEDIDGADIEPEAQLAFDDTDDEYWCMSCNKGIDDDELWDCAEPIRHYISNNGLVAECGDSGDIFVIESPYYTLAEFCSPCAPGAGYIMSKGDIKAYCFGHDWFEGGKAPYKVYSVENDRIVGA